MSNFGFKTPEDSPGFLLWQVMICWQRQIKHALALYDLAHSDFVIMAVTLWYMEQDIKPTQVIVSKLSKLDKMTISKSLRQLVQKGFITRSEDQTDTRAKILELTDEGKKFISKIIPVVESIDADFFNKIDKDEYGDMIQIFRKLVR